MTHPPLVRCFLPLSVVALASLAGGCGGSSSRSACRADTGSCPGVDAIGQQIGEPDVAEPPADTPPIPDADTQTPDVQVADTSTAHAPTILDLGANAPTLTEGQSVVVTAVVTDPDGIDDLIGGTLRHQATGASLGAFATAASEGAYSLEVTWEKLNQSAPITFDSSLPVALEAEFYDVGGNVTTAVLTLELQCGGAPACEGTCDKVMCEAGCQPNTFATDVYNCGKCGNQCALGAQCVDGQCVCPCGGNKVCEVCDGACVDLMNNDDHCGQCGHGCLYGCNDGRCLCDLSGGLDNGCFDWDTCHKWNNYPVCVGLGNFRLGDGVGGSGTLQLEVEGQWAGVCGADAAALNVGAVACRDLYGPGSTWQPSPTPATGATYGGVPFLARVTCPDPTATKLKHCTISFKEHCFEQEFVTGTCTPAD